jgi:hypothetical protein
MRHFLAARPVATRPHSMGEPPPTAALVAPSSRTLCVVAGAISAIAGAIDLTAIAAAADQRLAATSHAHKQPGRRGVTAVGSANIPWTNATLAAILASHACPARCRGTASSVTAKFRSAPCLPLWSEQAFTRRAQHRQPALVATTCDRITPTRPSRRSPLAFHHHIAGIRRV